MGNPAIIEQQPRLNDQIGRLRVARELKREETSRLCFTATALSEAAAWRQIRDGHDLGFGRIEMALFDIERKQIGSAILQDMAIELLIEYQGERRLCLSILAMENILRRCGGADARDRERFKTKAIRVARDALYTPRAQLLNRLHPTQLRNARDLVHPAAAPCRASPSMTAGKPQSCCCSR